MNKFKAQFLQFVFLLLITLPTNSADSAEQKRGTFPHSIHYFGFTNFEDALSWDDLGVEAPLPVPIFLNHALVPDSYGMPQGLEAFKLLFAGQEDLKTVRIKTQVPQHQYTFREKATLFFTGQKAPVSYFSGTMTPHSVLTNGHGFIEEVPSVSNFILKIFKSEKRLYRILEPIEIEQGLTLRPFKAEDS